MGIVHVAHLEAGTLTRQTAGAKGRHTALVGDLGQRVGLVHELREGVGAEECVDHRRDSLSIDQIDRSEDLVVAHIHTLADSTRHAAQAHTKLVVELLADSAHAAVAEVVDIVDRALRVDELDEILDDRDDILTGKHLHIHRCVKLELLVDTVATHFAEVITLVGEEEVLDHLTRRLFVGSLGIAQLTIDVQHSVALIVGRVLAECIVDDA